VLTPKRSSVCWIAILIRPLKRNNHFPLALQWHAKKDSCRLHTCRNLLGTLGKRQPVQSNNKTRLELRVISLSKSRAERTEVKRKLYSLLPCRPKSSRKQLFSSRVENQHITKLLRISGTTIKPKHLKNLKWFVWREQIVCLTYKTIPRL